MPSYLSSNARDLIAKLMNRNPKKRLGTMGGADEVKKHPFFDGIEWKKVMNKRYRMPEPYLSKRFRNFLKTKEDKLDNKAPDEYENIRKEAMMKCNLLEMKENYVDGWSFVIKDN